MSYENDVKSILQAASDLYHEQQSATVRDYRALPNAAESYANDLITFAKDQGWWEEWGKWEWSVMRDELVRLGLEDLEVEDES